MNTSIDEKSSAALISNAAVEKLVEFAKAKRFITWDDVIEYLGQEFVNSDELMEPVLKQLKDINREPVETDIIGAEDVSEDELVDDEDDDGIMLQDEHSLAFFRAPQRCIHSVESGTDYYLVI